MSGSADELILVMKKKPSVFLDIEFDFDTNRTNASPPLLEIRRFPDENTSQIEVTSFFPSSISNKGKQQVQYEVPKGIVELLLHIDPPVDPYINNSVISSPGATRWIYDLNESSWTQQSDSQKEKICLSD